VEFSGHNSLQESFLLPSSRLNIPGFSCICFDSSSPRKDLCLFVRHDYNFSYIDCSNFLHDLLVVINIKIHCSLDVRIHIFNVYPNSQMPHSLFNNFFMFISSFNTIPYYFRRLQCPSYAWGDSRCDAQGESIMRICDAYQLSIQTMGSLPLLLHLV